MNVIENNKIIAKFIGMSYVNNGQPNKYWELTDEQNFVCNKAYPQDKDLRFHSSWDWLMGAVDKISDQKHWSLNATIEWLSESQERDGLYNIGDLYQAVVEFIKSQN